MANHAPMESNKGRPGPNFTKAGPVISKVRLKTRHQRRNARSECVQIRSRAIRGIKKNVNWQNRTPTRQRDTRGVRLSSGGSAAADFTLALASLLCYVSIHWSRIQYPRKIWNDFHPPLVLLALHLFWQATILQKAGMRDPEKMITGNQGSRKKVKMTLHPLFFLMIIVRLFWSFWDFFETSNFTFFCFFSKSWSSL